VGSTELKKIKRQNLTKNIGLCKIIVAFPVLQKVIKIGEAFPLYPWSWVPKSANKVVDWLASFKIQGNKCFYVGR
ncbi:hypothetical protein DVH24_019738, partial [Malus domestica]